MARRLLAALAAISITVSVLFGDSVDCFDGGGKSEPQPTLCDELILPAGYPCSEYMGFFRYWTPAIKKFLGELSQAESEKESLLKSTLQRLIGRFL